MKLKFIYLFTFLIIEFMLVIMSKYCMNVKHSQSESCIILNNPFFHFVKIFQPSHIWDIYLYIFLPKHEKKRERERGRQREREREKGENIIV